MQNSLKIPASKLPEEAGNFRSEVRTFLEEELKEGSFESRCDSWLGGYSVEFSKKLGKKGWLGMTWPKEYGGNERSALERYILTEELLVFGAPVALHWFADRQTGPLLLKYGTEKQKDFFLPKITKGELYFAIGLSEPNSGSDLASISTRAIKNNGKWIINGSKIWSSGAHRSHYMMTLLRTSSRNDKKKNEGLSQIIIDLNAPGVTVRPIHLMTGEHHFNEVVFEDVEVSEEMIVGEVGNGWEQSMAELAYERSGPERFLSTYPLLNELVNTITGTNDTHAKIEIGKLVSRLWTLRQMSLGIASLLNEGKSSNIAASLVKDLGTQFETDIIEVTDELVDLSPSMKSKRRIDVLLSEAILHAPGFTLRGGSTEVLRSIISKGLGL